MSKQQNRSTTSTSTSTSTPASTSTSTSTSTSNSTSKPKTLDALTSSLNETRLNSHSRDKETDPSNDKFNLPIHQFLLPTNSSTTNSNFNSNSSEESISNLSAYLLHQIEFNQGEILIKLGHSEDGSSLNLSEKQHSDARNLLKEASKLAQCVVQVLDESKEKENHSAKLLVRRLHNDISNLMEVRIACAGNVDAGKSSTLGVLTRGALDDGRGKARVSLFRHKHEIETGRTSSVGMEIMGFDSNGSQTIKAEEVLRKVTWEEVCHRSAKVISFIDLAGHERYLRTTVAGLTGCLPDYVMLLVGANAGLIGMAKEHLGIALALALPVFICITKIDMTPAHVYESTVKQLTKVLKSPGCRKTPIFVENASQAVDAAIRLGKERVAPIFPISNVTGAGLDNVRLFLNTLPISGGHSQSFDSEASFSFQISDTFSVPFAGTVVSGVITSGQVKAGDTLLLGPDSLGAFFPSQVRSIQRKRVNVDHAIAGQSASFALKRVRRNQVRRGMVMLAKDATPKAHFEFEAEILCLYHSTTLAVGSCMVLHAAGVRQTVRICSITKLDDSDPDTGLDGKPVVRTGDRARIRFRFIRYAEYLETGTKIITREGRTKLIGIIRNIGGADSMVAPVVAAPSSPTQATTNLHNKDRDSTNSGTNTNPNRHKTVSAV